MFHPRFSILWTKPAWRQRRVWAFLLLPWGRSRSVKADTQPFHSDHSLQKTTQSSLKKSSVRSRNSPGNITGFGFLLFLSWQVSRVIPSKESCWKKGNEWLERDGPKSKPFQCTSPVKWQFSHFNFCCIFILDKSLNECHGLLTRHKISFVKLSVTL